MGLIRRAVALTAATAMAALVTVAASACGATTATGTTTNGLEMKSPADVLQEAAAALLAAKSVHVVGTTPSGNIDARMQGGSSTGTLTQAGVALTSTIIGSDGYAKTDQAGLQMLGVPLAVQRHDARRWLKIPAQDFNGLTLAAVARS